ncbi:hypothetical protein L7F22_060882 [Adiantum nelumboides]|nr:hypothetical protein [Adiantum nelumboides]
MLWSKENTEVLGYGVILLALPYEVINFDLLGEEDVGVVVDKSYNESAGTCTTDDLDCINLVRWPIKRLIFEDRTPLIQEESTKTPTLEDATMVDECEEFIAGHKSIFVRKRTYCMVNRKPRVLALKASNSRTSMESIAQAAPVIIEVLQRTEFCGFFFNWGSMCMAIGAALTSLLRAGLEEEMEMDPISMEGLFSLVMKARIFARGHVEKKIWEHAMIASPTKDEVQESWLLKPWPPPCQSILQGRVRRRYACSTKCQIVAHEDCGGFCMVERAFSKALKKRYACIANCISVAREDCDFRGFVGPSL